MDQTLLDLYRIVGKKNGVSEELVEKVVKYTFGEVSNVVSKHLSHDILLHNFVRFKTPKSKVVRYLEGVEKSYENGNMKKSKYLKLKETLNNILDE